jgi:hypothetical protein
LDSIDEQGNDQLLGIACGYYVSSRYRSTPEILVFMIWYGIAYPGHLKEVSPESSIWKEFAEAGGMARKSRDEQLELCRNLLIHLPAESPACSTLYRPF